MPSREQLGAAMRAAAQAGDHEAARKLAQAYNAMPPTGMEAITPEPAGAGGMFREQLQAPLEQFGKPFPPVVEQAFREVVTEDIPQSLANAVKASGTHYRTLAHGVGLPVDPPTEPESDAYKGALIDMLLTTGGGGVGRLLGKTGGDILKSLGRGVRSRPATQRMLDETRMVDKMTGSSHYVPAGAASRSTPLNEWGKPVISGAIADRAVDAMNFGQNEYVDAPIAGGAAAVTAAATGRDALTNLLLANPKWRDMMMRPTKGRAAMLMGALLGHYAAKTLTVDDAVSEVERQLSAETETGRR